MIYTIPYVLLVILLGFLAILIEQKKEDEAFVFHQYRLDDLLRRV